MSQSNAPGGGEYVLVPREPTGPMVSAGMFMPRGKRLFTDTEGKNEVFGSTDAIALWKAMLAAAPLAPERGPVAWSFELARSIIPETGQYTNWGPPQLSFTKPNVPEGSIRNLLALSPSPAHTGEELVRALEWYAEQVEGCRKITSEGNAARSALDADGGKRARAALTIAKDGWFRIDDTENPAPKDGWFLGRWYTTDKAGHADWVIVQMRTSVVVAGRQYYETWDLRLLTDPSHWRHLPQSPKDLGE